LIQRGLRVAEHSRRVVAVVHEHAEEQREHGHVPEDQDPDALLPGDVTGEPLLCAWLHRLAAVDPSRGPDVASAQDGSLTPGRPTSACSRGPTRRTTCAPPPPRAPDP